MAKKKGLGRGLEALLPEIGQALDPGSAEGSITIPVDKIRASRHQARKKFDEESLKGLAKSISEHGVAQPIVVAPMDENGFYEIIMGERRWRASKMAGLSEIPATVKAYSEKEKAVLSIIENLQREDLNPIEQAEGFKQIMDEFGYNQEELSKTLGKSRPLITNTLRLLSLPAEIQKAVEDGKISAGHARAIAAIEDPAKQHLLLEKIMNQHLSVRGAEKLIYKAKKSRPRKDPEIIAIENELQQILGTKVDIVYRKGRGKISISCFSLDDLNKIIDILKGKKPTKK